MNAYVDVRTALPYGVPDMLGVALSEAQRAEARTTGSESNAWANVISHLDDAILYARIALSEGGVRLAQDDAVEAGDVRRDGSVVPYPSYRSA